jgi:hypothetical protein
MAGACESGDSENPVSLLADLDAFFTDHAAAATWTPTSRASWSRSPATAAPVSPGERMKMAMPADIEIAPRGRRLRAALAAVLVPDNAPELRLVRDWPDNWSGIGLIIAGHDAPGLGCAVDCLRSA